MLKSGLMPIEARQMIVMDLWCWLIPQVSRYILVKLPGDVAESVRHEKVAAGIGFAIVQEDLDEPLVVTIPLSS